MFLEHQRQLKNLQRNELMSRFLMWLVFVETVNTTRKGVLIIGLDKEETLSVVCELLSSNHHVYEAAIRGNLRRRLVLSKH
uniref:Uncharacterized protein n=1 Tax=Noccaea caerulescens TaxID=107243 RepID=A0A1J3FJE7_NOCCA